MRIRPVHLLLGMLVLCTAIAMAEERPPLLEDLDDFVAEGWIYDDIEAGYAEAHKTGKPLLIVFR